MVVSSTTPFRARTKSKSFMPCWYSSTLCALSHFAAPVNFSRSQNAAMLRYEYHAENSELICTLIARSTSAFIESVSLRLLPPEYRSDWLLRTTFGRSANPDTKSQFELKNVISDLFGRSTCT